MNNVNEESCEELVQYLTTIWEEDLDAEDNRRKKSRCNYLRYPLC